MEKSCSATTTTTRFSQVRKLSRKKFDTLDWEVRRFLNVQTCGLQCLSTVERVVKWAFRAGMIGGEQRRRFGFACYHDPIAHSAPSALPNTATAQPCSPRFHREPCSKQTALAAPTLPRPVGEQRPPGRSRFIMDEAAT